jgi:hypothetical protein
MPPLDEIHINRKERMKALKLKAVLIEKISCHLFGRLKFPSPKM